jgi:3-(3-hydroxy-phenyl)propionate hydroxylase
MLQTASNPTTPPPQGTPREVLRTDVLVVGLGPVGAAMANMLVRQGVHVLAIDKALEPFDKPRAIALDNEALRILQSLGVRDGDFSTLAIPQLQYHSPLFGRFARIATAGSIDGHPKLVTFYQPELEAVLRARLRKASLADIRLGAELLAFADDGRGVAATVREASGRELAIHARFLVAADGAGSVVRHQLGLEFDGTTFQQDWLIVDARDVPNPVDHCSFICDPRRPTPRMVAPGGRQRWEFMLRPGESREEMEKPETVKRLLAPWCDADRVTIERTAVYRFHAREARAFSRGRCFLVGDAAHITPPFAGQGLVAGLRDVSNLAWKLAWVTKGRASESLLESYDAERRPHARKIIRLARFLGALVMPSNRLAAFAIHGLMRGVQVVPRIRALFEDLKIKPQNSFDRGCFEGQRGDRLRAGSAFPQGWVRSPTMPTPRLSDDALGDGWSLVGFGRDPHEFVSKDDLAAWEAAGGRIWQWCHRGQAQHLGAPGIQLEALDDVVLPGRVPIGWAAIVRPDRCVFIEGPVEESAAMLRRAVDVLAGTPEAGTHASLRAAA